MAAWLLFSEMNYSGPYQWAIYGDSDSEIVIEYYDWDFKGDRRQGAGKWSIVGPDLITITRAYIVYRTSEDQNIRSLSGNRASWTERIIKFDNSC